MGDRLGDFGIFGQKRTLLMRDTVGVFFSRFLVIFYAISVVKIRVGKKGLF